MAKIIPIPTPLMIGVMLYKKLRESAVQHLISGENLLSDSSKNQKPDSLFSSLSQKSNPCQTTSQELELNKKHLEHQ